MSHFKTQILPIIIDHDDFLVVTVSKITYLESSMFSATDLE